MTATVNRNYNRSKNPLYVQGLRLERHLGEVVDQA